MLLVPSKITSFLSCPTALTLAALYHSRTEACGVHTCLDSYTRFLYIIQTTKPMRQRPCIEHSGLKCHPDLISSVLTQASGPWSILCLAHSLAADHYLTACGLAAPSEIGAPPLVAPVDIG